MMRKQVVAIGMVFMLSGCGMYVKQSTYNEALTNMQAAQGERDVLANKVRDLEANLDKSGKEVAALTEKAQAAEQNKGALEAKLKTTELELEEKTNEIAQLKNDLGKLTKDLENLRIAKDKEINEIKLKIKDISTRAEALLDKIKDVLKSKDAE